jgi:hypothetical protein
VVGAHEDDGWKYRWTGDLAIANALLAMDDEMDGCFPFQVCLDPLKNVLCKKRFPVTSNL